MPGFFHLPNGHCAPCSSNLYAYAAALVASLIGAALLLLACRRRLEPYLAPLSKLWVQSSTPLALLVDQLLRLALLHRLTVIPFPNVFSAMVSYVGASAGFDLTPAECVVTLSFNQKYWVTIGAVFCGAAAAAAVDAHLALAGLRVDVGQRLVLSALDVLLPIAVQPSFSALASRTSGRLISDGEVPFLSGAHKPVLGFSICLILLYAVFLLARSATCKAPSCARNACKKRVVELETIDTEMGGVERESRARSRAKRNALLARYWVGFLRMFSILLQMVNYPSPLAASIWLLGVSALEVVIFALSWRSFRDDAGGGLCNGALLVLVFLATNVSAVACALLGDVVCADLAPLGGALIALNALLALSIVLPVCATCRRALRRRAPLQSSPRGAAASFFKPHAIAGASPLSNSGRHLLVAAFGVNFLAEKNPSLLLAPKPAKLFAAPAPAAPEEGGPPLGNPLAAVLDAAGAPLPGEASAPLPGEASAAAPASAPQPATREASWREWRDDADTWYSNVATGEVAWALPPGEAVIPAAPRCPEPAPAAKAADDEWPDPP